MGVLPTHELALVFRVGDVILYQRMKECATKNVP